MLRGELVDGPAQWVTPVGRCARAKAHVDHVGSRGRRPLHPVDDPAGQPAAAVIEHLADEEPGPGCHPGVVPVGGLTVPGDDAGDVGSVPVAVARRSRRQEGPCVGDPAGQVGVALVDPGVEDGNRRTGSVESEVPGLRCSDLGHARVECGLDRLVEPHLRAFGQRPRELRALVPCPVGDCGPPRRPARVDGTGDSADAAQRRCRVEAGQPVEGHGVERVAPLRRREDDGHTAIEVEAVLDELGDVEQFRVEPARNQRRGVGGDDVDLPRLAADLVRRLVATALGELDLDGLPATRRLVHGDAVAGDQSDGVDGPGCRRRGGRGAGPFGAFGGRAAGRAAGRGSDGRTERSEQRRDERSAPRRARRSESHRPSILSGGRCRLCPVLANLARPAVVGREPVHQLGP